METKIIKGLGQKVKKLNINGLTIYLVPYNNRDKYYIEYIVKYGSTFMLPNVKTPQGVAHFIEHKVFEQEKGPPPFEYFSLTGTDCNAATSYDNTTYYIEGNISIEENLNYLLKFINKPFFTNQNVEKEKGIIAQEIRMYKDDPESIIERKCLEMVFKNHPMRYDIGGTEEEINKITKEILYDYYNTFYNTNNSILIVGGHFDEKRVLSVIKNNDEIKENNKELNIEIEEIKEQDDVFEHKKIIEMNNIFVPKILYTLKIPLKDIDKEKECLKIKLLFDILYGEQSSYYNEMLSSGIITDFAYYSTILPNFLLIFFWIEGTTSEEVISRLKDTFKNEGIDRKTLSRCKKNYISTSVINSDKISNLISTLSNQIIDYGDIIYNELSIVRKINQDEIEKTRKNIDIDNGSLLIAKVK